MIGFDRPVKPEWIYETLKMIQVGEKPSKYNRLFEYIAKELIGKEGKRKVRTVIFRSFIYSFQEKRTIIENNKFIEWVQGHPLVYMQPLFLLKLLLDYEITGFIIKKIDLNLKESSVVSSKIITQKMVQQFGDRDVVRRSVRSFLKTLVHFRIFKQLGTYEYQFMGKYNLSDEQVRDLLLIYMDSFLKSKVLDLSQIDPKHFYFFEEIDLFQIARKYHTKNWELIRDTNRNILMVR